MALKKTFVFALLIAAMAASAASAATVSFTIQLYDITGNAASGGALITPTSPGVYDIAPGTQFRTRVFAQVSSPNFTDGDRDPGAGLNNQALGIQNATGDLVTSGVNVVTPGLQVTGGPFSPPRWLNYNRVTGNTTAAAAFNASSPSFTNLIDQGSDGDLDPSGASILNNDFNLEDDGSVVSLAAGGYALGATSAQALFQGWFTAGASGSTQLTFNPGTVNVFNDPVGGDPLTIAAQAATGFTSTPITINIISAVPEPSTFALAGIGLLGLAFIRRRK